MKKLIKPMSFFAAITMYTAILCPNAACGKEVQNDLKRVPPSLAELNTIPNNSIYIPVKNRVNLNSDYYTIPVISHAQKRNELIRIVLKEIAEFIYKKFTGYDNL